MADAGHKSRTLFLCAVLHGFTHLYNVALIPLYVPIQSGLNLGGLADATLLVTVMMAAYLLPSYPMGMLADRISRKQLLGWGLFVNGAGFLALGLAPGYKTALVAAGLAGLGGSCYHPAATSMVARLYPDNTGRALGLVGMGASVGFFLGPVYSGWRAQAHGWRAPIIELGILGVAAAVAFLVFAEEEKASDHPEPAVRKQPLFPTPLMLASFIAACLFLSFRDFAGSSMATLSAIFLQQAHGFNLTATGFLLSLVFLASFFSNPLFGRLSDRGRNQWILVVLGVAAITIAVFPHLPKPLIAPAFMVYGFFFMASFPVIEAALMVAVPDAVRGRIIGLLITFSGLVGNLSHWASGRWAESLGPRAAEPSAWFSGYAILAGMILLSLCSVPCLRGIQRGNQHAVPALDS